MKSWGEIYKLEVTEQHPAAIEAIEERLKSNPSEDEAIIRLGFLLWLGIVENDRLELNIPYRKVERIFINIKLALIPVTKDLNELEIKILTIGSR